MFRTPGDNAAARDIARSPLAVPRRRQPSRHLDFATWAAAGYSAACSMAALTKAMRFCDAVPLFCALRAPPSFCSDARRRSGTPQFHPGTNRTRFDRTADRDSQPSGYREAAGAFGPPAVLVRATLAPDFALAFIDKTSAGGWPGEARWEACMNTRWYRSFCWRASPWRRSRRPWASKPTLPRPAPRRASPRSRTSPGFGGIHRCRVSSRRHPVPAR